MPSFTLVETKKEIASSQRRLLATISRDFTESEVRNMGYPGGTSFDAKIQTDGKYWFWSADSKDSTKRLNWFGLYKARGSLHISVEINTPFEGRNDILAGFYARDNDTGAVYLFHSGRVGGGKKGVGKLAFLAWTEQRPVEVVDMHGQIRYGILVMPVEGKRGTHPAIRYVDSIVQFKVAVRNGEVEPKALASKQQELQDYYSESSGRRKGVRATEIDYISRHGDVVDALKNWRSQQKLPTGSRIVKNILIDLGVKNRKNLTEIYEVKTSTTRSSVYGAIGQLFVHGVEDSCRRVIVLPYPEKLSVSLKEALDRLNIDIVWFSIDDDTVTILN